MYEEQLKAIAIAETEDERLTLAGELSTTIGDGADSEALRKAEEERDSLREQLEESQGKYNDLREKYVDRFFSAGDGPKPSGEGEQKQAPKAEPREGATLASLFGKE